MASRDEDLVVRAQAGEAEAFAALVDRHRGAVMRLARRLVARTEDARDLAQEAFVAAFQHLDTLRDRDRFGAWVRRIAVNVALQWRRREGQISFEPLWEEASTPPSVGVLPSDPGAERLRDLVRAAIAALPPASQDAVLLHYFDGYDYAETAALLDVPVSTVRGRLYLAREQLREELTELAPTKPKTSRPKESLTEFVLTPDDLTALRGAELLASRDATRSALQAICIEPDGTIVSTDTHRLYLSRGSSIRPSARALVSSSVFSPLKHRPGVKEARLALAGEEATLSYVDEHNTPPEQTNRGRILTKEKFPNYQAILPEALKIRATFAARDLLVALEEVARFEAFLASSAMPESGRPAMRVALTLAGRGGPLLIQDSALKAEPAPTHWSFQTEIPVAVDGPGSEEEFTIGFNRFYLRECVQALAIAPSEAVEMGLNEALLPVPFRPKGVEDRLIVLMPMFLRD